MEIDRVSDFLASANLVIVIGAIHRHEIVVFKVGMDVSLR